MSLNLSILSLKVKSFIQEHKKDNIPDLILKGSPFEDATIQNIAQQIHGLRIAEQKFPTLLQNENIIYPPKINLEQSSSEITASYKSKFIKENDNILDVTGGMGIDCLAFSNIAKSVTYIDIEENTCQYAKHNFEVLNKNIKAFNADGIEFLKQQNLKFDLIYLDPARRNKNKSKVYRLEDCTPNVLEHLEFLKFRASRILLKVSPLLDINYCIETLPNVESLHIVSVKNEVKELLISINFEINQENPVIIATNLKSSHHIFKAFYSDKDTLQDLSLPQKYIYEPNASLMKMGFFGEICKRFNLKALHANSHLFTSDEHIEFPGRTFNVLDIISPKKQLLRKIIKNNKANVATRNYPLKPQDVKKKYGLIDGGSLFVFFTTNLKNDKIVLICNKIID